MIKPAVSVVVCTHLEENRKYLDACLNSLEAQKGIDFEVILVSSGYLPDGLPKWLRHLHVDESLGWSEKVNAGVELSDPVTKYLFTLNDDVILSKHALATMVRKAGDSAILLNPMSNCDNGWVYHARITLEDPITEDKKLLTKRFYTYEELDGWQRAIMLHKPGADILLTVSQICFYATLIPRKVWNQVGILDPLCKYGYDDEDYCRRAAKFGIPSLIDLESFVLHFGGATSSKTNTQEMKDETVNYYRAKWANYE